MALFTRTMSVAFSSIIVAIKYCFFILKSRSIKNLHFQIQKDWMILRDKLESEIIQKYAHYGKYYTTLLFYEDKYVYIKALHEFVIILLCGLMMITTSMQLIIFTFHSFGMFKIASHRVKHSIEASVLRTSSLTKERAICQNITFAVIAHRRAMEFSNLFVSTFNIPYCILAIVGILSLSINIFAFLEAITVSKNMEDATISFFGTVAHLAYLFVANYIGQKVIDYNNEIFRLVYGTSWYLMPISSQKLILFLMQKTGKEFNLKIGFILEGKIENFTMVSSKTESKKQKNNRILLIYVQ
ncbi:uncharacterized protein [Anoplolepis gracilipes]|uniref:uncharacterized protein isoform X3 n=1 Tax=Anoplolepis gracilipes TaxID=354296 RepID=UPI003BA1C31E